MNVCQVLFIATDPKSHQQLDSGEEWREIDRKIRMSGYPQGLELKPIWAARPDDLLQALNEHRPQVVHFSGHGTPGEEILLQGDQGETRRVSKVALKQLFTTLKNDIRLVVLNACFTRSQAEEIVEVIDCAIGMNQTIKDRAAIVFAAAFYRALGFGKSVRDAFEQGRTSLLMEGFTQDKSFELLTRAGVDPSQVFLLAPAASPNPTPTVSAAPQPASPETSSTLGTWRERLNFLLREEAIASDPGIRFQLSQQIKEARAKISELGQTAVPPSPRPPSSAPNPFDPWNPAIGDRFVGRTSELRRLQTALDGGHSVNLVGDRRIGKSSLLGVWADRAQAGGRETRWLSGEEGEGRGIAEFVRAITNAPSSNEPDEAAEQLSAWANRVGRPGLPPLLIVDEFDGLIPRVEHRFLERLRGMLGRLLLVLGSRRGLDEIYHELGRTSPFYNRLETLWVGLLDKTATDALIARGSLWWQPGDTDLIHRLCGEHPFFIQLLGYHLAHARASGESTQQALDHFGDEADRRLRDLSRTWSDRERTALEDAAKGRSVDMRSLRTRGLVTAENRPFGQVLVDWLNDSR